MQQLITQFYENVDSEDWEYVLGIFDEGIEYERKELGKTHLLAGKPAIREFYTVTRDLKGKHFLHDITEDGNIVRVHGTFEGTKRGTSIKLEYVDEFEFNARGKVTKRKSRIRVATT